MATVTIYPVKDKFSNDWPYYNDRGNLQYLVIKDGRTASPTDDSISYIQFDLTPYEPDDIVSAILRVWAYDLVGWGNVKIDCNIKKVIEYWGEQTGYWWSQPSVSQSPYGQIHLGPDGWCQTDITQLVKEWATADNFGLQLTNTSGEYTGRQLYSRSGTHPEELVITLKTPTIGDFTPESITKIGPTW